jgi:UDP-glucose 4-epimerase
MHDCRFVLFGAGGFIGGNLARYFEREGLDYVSISRHSSHTIIADLNFPEQYLGLLKSNDVVVLLASATSSATSNASLDREEALNVKPYKTFLRAIAQIRLRRVIYISSGGAVYGSYTGVERASESTPLNPFTSYGWGKRQIEMWMVEFSQRSSVPVTILRPSNAVGYGQLITGVGLVAAALNAAERGSSLKIWGDGTVVRDYFDVEDLCRAIVLTALREPPTGQAINIGSGIGRSQLEVCAIVERVVGRSIDISFEPKRPTEIAKNILAIERADSWLGWHPTIDLNQSILRLVSYGKRLR